MKVCFNTFGCRLNRAEALEMEAKFIAAGWEKTKTHSDADLIIVRACSVTARAQRDCEKFISHLKSKYPTKRIFITGCTINKTSPAIIDKVLGEANNTTDFIVPNSTARAYLKIQDGCNCNCSFCIVPKFRGKSTSVDFATVLEKAERFLDCGYNEIVLTGCNMALYLSDGKRLAELIASLAALRGAKHRLRIGSLEPGAAALDVVKVMAEHQNICKFLHIPIQSASSRILREMKRPYTLKDVSTLVEHAIEAIPNLGLGCDIISGFPTETDNDHRATLEFLRRYPFSNAHAFPYSERPGTSAATMHMPIEKSIRSARAHEIAKLVKDKRQIFARRFKGTKVQIVVENAKEVAGWTSQYIWCSQSGARSPIKGANLTSKKYRRREFAEIVVTDIKGDRLFGNIA